MTTKYLYPCPACGRKHEVDTSKVGLPFVCECGAKLEVKSLRALKELEPKPVDPAALAPVWGPRQGMTLLGSVVAISGLLAILITLWATPSLEPRKIDDTSIREQAKQLSLADSHQLWRQIRDVPIDQDVYQEEQIVNQYMAGLELRRAQRTSSCVGWGALAFVGLIIVGVAQSLPKTPGPAVKNPASTTPV